MAKATAGKKPASKRKHEFQAEVSKLLHLMVHSVYSEREIFLRELISNAADACDKLRYEAVTKADLLGEDPELKITISLNKDAGTLTVTDNGIGMSEAELIDNLGTIARSGTRAFIDKLEAQKDGSNLIGQFGVGFYSAFMAADQVTVFTRRAGTGAVWKWVSDGEAGFTVTPAAKKDTARLARGTEVILHLKDEAKEDYLQPGAIERIVRAYSDHVSFPIELIETDGEARQINTAGALWMRPKGEIGEDQYREFYHHAAQQFDDPAVTLHYRAEGRHEYAVLLFVPGSKPFDLYDPGRKGHIRLYVRRVFINDDADLLPAYLRFVRGVIDSEDMPLNISREMLQNNPIVASIRKAVTKRVLSELAKTADKDAESFTKIWEAFGPVLKEGLYEDVERRDLLFELARFRSTTSQDWRSLKDYVADMKDNQTAIYYITGENAEQIKASPQLEGYRARGVEVLLLSDPVDSFWTSSALGFDGKPFKSVTQGDDDLAAIPLADGEEETAPDAGEAAALIVELKNHLGDAVGDVRVSARLTQSPCCLVAPSGGPDRELEKLMAKHQGAGAGTAPILEINPGHPLVKVLAEKAKGGNTAELEDAAWLLFDQGRILDGEAPADPAKFTERLTRLMMATSS